MSKQLKQDYFVALAFLLVLPTKIESNIHLVESQQHVSCVVVQTALQ
jgi:hypothetical protein